MRRVWLSAASSTSPNITEFIDNFQKTNRCCGYSDALDYCCLEQVMEIVPTYINEIEPIEDKIEDIRLELEKQNVTRDMKVIRERNKELELRLIDLKLVESTEMKLQTSDYMGELTGNFSADIFLYYDELNYTDTEVLYYETEDEEMRLKSPGEVGLVSIDDILEMLDNGTLINGWFDEWFDGNDCEPDEIRYNSVKVKVLHNHQHTSYNSVVGLNTGIKNGPFSTKIAELQHYVFWCLNLPLFIQLPDTCS